MTSMHANAPLRRYAAARTKLRPPRYLPGEILLGLYRCFGPVLHQGLGRHGYIYVLGSDANKFVFANANAFSWRGAFRVRMPVDGTTALIVSDGEPHRQRRNMVQGALHARQVRQYMSTMAANADAVIDGWRTGQRVDIYQQFRSAIRRSAIESLFGPRFAERAEVIGENLEPLLALTHGLPLSQDCHRWTRSPAWRRGLAARRRIDAIVGEEIERVRATPVAQDHVLANLIHGVTEDGKSLSDNEIRDQIVSIIAGSYDSTSGVMAWAIYAMLTNPGVWDRAASEVVNVTGGKAPDASDLPGLRYLSGVVHETLRLYSPGVVSARIIMRDLQFHGSLIPAGRMLVFSPYVTHRLADLWPQPLRFMPERWDADSPGYRKPAPYEFIPFSGGLHRCVGSSFATVELIVMLARLLSRTSLRLPRQRIVPSGYAALHPRHGLRVDIERVEPASGR
jgi:cytochrome P450